MTTCPCCSNPMLRHIRSQRMVWFCRHCWQEMPDLVENRAQRLHSRRLVGGYRQIGSAKQKTCSDAVLTYRHASA